MKKYKVDLHIHTSASPCAMHDMTPVLIVEAAAERGIDIIAVSDHNTAENVDDVFAEGSSRGITVLPAIEVTTTEEAHILALFDTPQKAHALEAIIHMRHKRRKSEREGRDNFLSLLECDETFESVKKSAYDFMWSGLSLREAVEKVHSLGGMVIASHIDRDFMSVISQLGKIPDDLFFEALEISFATPQQVAERRYSQYASIPWIRSSDAHQLDDIGRQATFLELNAPDFQGIADVLRDRRMDLIGYLA